MKIPSLVAIQVRPAKGAPCQDLSSVHLEAGFGPLGDYGTEAGRSRGAPRRPKEQVTLIAREDLEAFRTQTGIALSHAESRRNLLVQGVDLNALVGRAFRLGSVLLKGIEPCDPCRPLERKTYPGVLKGLMGRGGLRAEVVTGGEVQIGDSIEVEAEPGSDC